MGGNDHREKYYRSLHCCKDIRRTALMVEKMRNMRIQRRVKTGFGIL